MDRSISKSKADGSRRLGIIWTSQTEKSRCVGDNVLPAKTWRLTGMAAVSWDQHNSDFRTESSEPSIFAPCPNNVKLILYHLTWTQIWPEEGFACLNDTIVVWSSAHPGAISIMLAAPLTSSIPHSSSPKSQASAPKWPSMSSRATRSSRSCKIKRRVIYWQMAGSKVAIVLEFASNLPILILDTCIFQTDILKLVMFNVG